MDYKRNKRYFKRFGLKIPIAMIIIGPIMILLESEASTTVLGLLLAGAGVAMLIAFHNMTPTDEEIDQVTYKMLEKTKEESLDKLKKSYNEFNLEEPIVISNYFFRPVSGHRPFTRMGKDRLYRSSLFNSAMFIFTDHQLIYQRTVFSIVHPMVKTFVEEYYYDDIVTVKTHESTSSAYNEKSQYSDLPEFTYNSFELITKGGNNVSFTFQQNEKIDQVVDYMKKMIRQRKFKESTE